MDKTQRVSRRTVGPARLPPSISAKTEARVRRDMSLAGAIHQRVMAEGCVHYDDRNRGRVRRRTGTGRLGIGTESTSIGGGGRAGPHGSDARRGYLIVGSERA